jgi:hypothetical protein
VSPTPPTRTTFKIERANEHHERNANHVFNKKLAAFPAEAATAAMTFLLQQNIELLHWHLERKAKKTSPQTRKTLEKKVTI